MSELLPCPRCRSNECEKHKFMHDNSIFCRSCGLGGKFLPTMDEAVVWWDTRQPDPLLEEMARALGDLLFECDGITSTCAPKRQTYNDAFATLQKYRERQ